MIDAALPGDTVTIPAGIYYESLIIDKDITLQGVSPDLTTIKRPPDNDQRIITVNDGYDLTLQNLEINGEATYILDIIGGSVYIKDGTLTVVNCLITNNYALSGAGIYQAGEGGVTIKDSVLLNNSSVGFGGGVYIGGEIFVEYSSIIGNWGQFGGGGIYAAGHATIVDSEISYNWASEGNGGGLSVNGSFTMESSTLSHNNTFMQGGAIHHPGDDTGLIISIKDSLVDWNRATLGGGLNVMAGVPTLIENTTFVRNWAYRSDTADTRGGAISYTGSQSEDTLTILRSLIKENSAGCDTCDHGEGGGVYA